MNDLKYLAIGVAVVAVLVLSSVYYGVFGKQLAELSPAYVPDPESGPRPPASKMLVIAVIVSVWT